MNFIETWILLLNIMIIKRTRLTLPNGGTDGCPRTDWASLDYFMILKRLLSEVFQLLLLLILGLSFADLVIVVFGVVVIVVAVV